MHDRAGSYPTKTDIARVFVEREKAIHQYETMLAANRSEVMPLISLIEDMGGSATDTILSMNASFSNAARIHLDNQIRDALVLSPMIERPSMSE